MGQGHNNLGDANLWVKCNSELGSVADVELRVKQAWYSS